MPVSSGQFRELACGFPGVEERAHMGHPDFRVGNRIFASLTADETRCAMKCDPVNVAALVRADAETYRDAWRGSWLGVVLGRVDRETLRGLLEDAWRMTAGRRAAREYDGPTGG